VPELAHDSFGSPAGGSVLDITLHLAASIRRRPTAARCGARRVYSAIREVTSCKLGSWYMGAAAERFTETSASGDGLSPKCFPESFSAPKADRVIAEYVQIHSVLTARSEMFA
jgi:hypothetical protein